MAQEEEERQAQADAKKQEILAGLYRHYGLYNILYIIYTR